MKPYEEAYRIVLAEAKRTYEIATRVYHEQFQAGGIVKLDPEDIDDRDEIGKGRKHKPVTPAGKMAFGMWQKAKAELDAAHHNLIHVPGACPKCNPPEDRRSIDVSAFVAKKAPEPDRRLPPEKDDDGVPF